MSLLVEGNNWVDWQWFDSFVGADFDIVADVFLLTNHGADLDYLAWAKCFYFSQSFCFLVFDVLRLIEVFWQTSPWGFFAFLVFLFLFFSLFFSHICLLFCVVVLFLISNFFLFCFWQISSGFSSGKCVGFLSFFSLSFLLDFSHDSLLSLISLFLGLSLFFCLVLSLQSCLLFFSFDVLSDYSSAQFEVLRSKLSFS